MLLSQNNYYINFKTVNCILKRGFVSNVVKRLQLKSEENIDILFSRS